MQLERYAYEADRNFNRFMFESVGPKGVIKKVVNFEFLYSYNNIAVVNLAFGDWDKVNHKIDDSVVSNNNDRDKILATVAATVLEYTKMHGRCLVFAEGSTPARTRLYQMGINAHFIDIESIFIVMGRYEGEWMPFEQGRNFDAFSVMKK